VGKGEAVTRQSRKNIIKECRHKGGKMGSEIPCPKGKSMLLAKRDRAGLRGSTVLGFFCGGIRRSSRFQRNHLSLKEKARGPWHRSFRGEGMRNWRKFVLLGKEGSPGKLGEVERGSSGRKI